MKQIPLHKVDLPDSIKFIYDWAVSKFDENINKSKVTFRFLFYVFKDSSEILECNALLQNTEVDHKRIFRYGLNCISEFCRLAHFPDQEKEAQIDESGKFVVKVQETHLFQGFFTALSMARIARNEEKEKLITNLPLELLDLERNITFSHVYIHALMKLELDYSNLKRFNEDHFNTLVGVYEKNKTQIKAKVDTFTNHTLYYIHPYVLAFKSFADNNEAAFNAYLIKALEAYKEVWSQKKALNRGGTPLCRENEGFLSWGLTALAAMAHDRGWKLEVQSDYIPQYMIDGSINV